MKKYYTPIKRSQLLNLLFVALIFVLPLDLFGQKGNGNGNGNGNSKEIEIIVSCIEYKGGEQLIAHFGYENPSNKTIVINEDGSVVTYNHGQAIKAGLYIFEPGVNEKAFSQNFDAKDIVEWEVTLPNGKVKTVTANINLYHCPDDGLPIIPGYSPPEGGKEYDSKIGAELTSLWGAFDLDPSFSDAPEDIFQISGTKVLIEVVANTDPDEYVDLLASLSGLFTLETTDPLLNKATGWVEIADLLLLNAIDALHYARPVYPGMGNAYSVPLIGVTNSQGDFAMHSDFARLGYDIDGTGVKIGVLSNSYATQVVDAAQDVENGDLPGPENRFDQYKLPVHVIEDYTKGILSDEGRAMLQIIHDIAPGAELAFRTGFLGEQDMAEGIRELADAGCDIIVDDLSYITEPFFTDGVISKAINEVVNDDKVTFFSSAGNFGKYSYMGNFQAYEAPATIIGDAHDFSDGDGDIFQGVTLDKGSYTLVLQWDDGSDASMNTTKTDLDIFLSDDVGYSLLGFNRENVGGFPIEVVPFSIQEESVEVNVVIARASGDRAVTFKYILFRGGPQFHMDEYGGGGSSTIVGHPNAKGAITVGAVRFDKNPVYSNPLDYPLPVIMSFSSVGGTPVIGEPTPRSKPDITAPNGVNTTVNLGNGDWDTSEDPVDIDPDTQHPNFFGTSAASPHAAGVAALLIQAGLDYQSNVPLTPEEIRTIMRSSTIEKEMGLEDNFVSGSGFIQAHKAIMTFANPIPEVENLILETEGGITEGMVSFTVNGDFFTDDTQVRFRGEILPDENVDVVDDSTIIVQHPEFLGNADVQAYNEPISNSQDDGGDSDPVSFSDPVKRKIFLNADSYSKKFGEVTPVYKVTILVEVEEGAPALLQTAILDGIIPQDEADRISDLVVLTYNSEASNVGEYKIRPSLNPEFDPDDPQGDVDMAIASKYTFEFGDGTMNIDKLPLKITPIDVDMIYGQPLPGESFSFMYEIDDTGLDLGLTLEEVKTDHLATITTNKVALVRGVALVNGIPMIRGTALVNGVTMIRGTALVNGVEVKVEGEGDERTVYVAGEAVASGTPLLRGVALVNDLPFVNMTQIIRGVALVNGSELNIADGYMSLGDDPVVSGIPVIRGVALVNGPSSRGIALVNEHTVEVDLSGVTTIDGKDLPAEAVSGLSLVNGIPVLRGTALVNSSLISRGIALVNELGVEITNGIPTGRGIALVNGSPLRGIALVNGLPLIRGTALVNNLEVIVDDGEVIRVNDESGKEVQTLGLTSRGVALVNDIALVNGGKLISRGTALVNGIALTDADGTGDELVNLANMNFLASSSAIGSVTNGLKNVRGTALVNGMEGVNGEALKVAANGIEEDDKIVFESSISRGIALVNGLAYVRGTALVNNGTEDVELTNTHALVNGTTIDDDSNNGNILIFDATDIDPNVDGVEFKPMSFITGTTAGKHWIIPGTFLSDNYEITYGLGTLTIDPAPMTVTITAANKDYDGKRDAVVSFADVQSPNIDLSVTYESALFEDKHVDDNKLVTVNGLAVQGPGVENYILKPLVMPKANITARDLLIGITASDKNYDGTTTATTRAEVLSGLVTNDAVTVSSSNGLFVDKHVGPDKKVTASVSATGDDAGNYNVNTVAETTASIKAINLAIGITAENKTYDGNNAASTSAHVVSGLVGGDNVGVQSSSGYFSTANAGTGLVVTAYVNATGGDAGNYKVNSTAMTTANIFQKDVYVTPLEDEFAIAMKDPLPDPAFDYDGWIAGDEENFGYTAIRDSDGIAYDPESKKSYGHYILTPEPFNANYSFIIETSLLYVRKHDDVGHDDDKHDHHSKSAAVSGALAEVEELNPDVLLAYPNPVVDKVHLSLKDIENYKLIQLYDFTGKSHQIRSIDKQINLLEIEMAHLSSGSYFIRVIMDDDSSRVVQIIKK